MDEDNNPFRRFLNENAPLILLLNVIKKINADKDFNDTGISNGYFLERKREILNTLGSNLLLKDRKLRINLGNCLLPMKKVSLGFNNKKSGFEPLDLCLDKRKNTALGGARPDWLRGPDISLLENLRFALIFCA